MHVRSSSSTGSGILSSAGIGSGLNVDSIVTALVDAKKAGPQAQITNKATQANATLTGLASLSSALTSLQSSLSKLTQTSTFSSFNAALADTTVGTASTLSNAQPGSYALDVTQLATAQKRSSDAYAKTDTFGSRHAEHRRGQQDAEPVGVLHRHAGRHCQQDQQVLGQSRASPPPWSTVPAASQLLLSSNKTGVANGFTDQRRQPAAAAGLSALATQLGTAGSNEAQGRPADARRHRHHQRQQQCQRRDRRRHHQPGRRRAAPR